MRKNWTAFIGTALMIGVSLVAVNQAEADKPKKPPVHHKGGQDCAALRDNLNDAQKRIGAFAKKHRDKNHPGLQGLRTAAKKASIQYRNHCRAMPMPIPHK